MIGGVEELHDAFGDELGALVEDQDAIHVGLVVGAVLNVLAEVIGHDFPGNVRELQNLVEAALSLAEDNIEPDLIHSLMGEPDEVRGPEPLDLQTAESRHIARILRMTGGNKSRAAKLLGVDRRTLQRKGF